VIFDCDGVLVDSEHISSRVFAEIIEKHGVQVSPAEVFAKLRGGSMQEAVNFVVEKIGKQPDFDIEKVYRKRSFELYETEMEAIPGVEDVLKNLAYPICVGSNGPKNKIEFNLKVTGLDKYFSPERLFSAYDEGIRTWKPKPKLFLTAATKLGYEPKNCIVIEDSVHGAEAAQRAGMHCFGYIRDTDPADFEKFGAVPFDDMSKLIDLIKQIS